MKKLYRSSTDRMLGGVCGGIAQYLDADSTLIRVLFVILTLAGGNGILIYIILWIVMPSQYRIENGSDYASDKNK